MGGATPNLISSAMYFTLRILLSMYPEREWGVDQEGVRVKRGR